MASMGASLARGQDQPVSTPAAAQTPPPSGTWLKRRVIRFGGDFQYEPMEWLDRDGKAQGLHVALIQEMGKVLDADVEVTLGAWNEIFAKLQRGELDVVAMAKQPEREPLVDFCDAHTVSVSEIFIRREGQKIAKLEDLAGKVVLVQSSGLAEMTLKTRVPGAKLRGADSQTELLTRLAAGEGDAAVAEQLTSRLIIHKNGLSNLASTGPAVLSSEYAFAVTHGHQKLREDLNRALAVVKNTGVFSTLYERWIVQPTQDGVPMRRVLVWTLGVGGPLAILLLGASVWNYTLRRRVRTSLASIQRELRERQNAEEQARLLLAELDHRVRNTLASIIGLVQQSPVRDTTTAEQFKAVLLERVRAMSVAHDAMRKAPAEGVEVAGAMAMLLRAHDAALAERIRIKGGSVRLSTRSTTPVCLVLHELVSNAAEWGALRPGWRGEVTLSVSKDQRGTIVMHWDESAEGVRAGSMRPGFGLSIMRGLIEHQLGGSFEWELLDGGVKCVIELPRDSAQADTAMTIEEAARTPSTPLAGHASR